MEIQSRHQSLGARCQVLSIRELQGIMPGPEPGIPTPCPRASACLVYLLREEKKSVSPLSLAPTPIQSQGSFFGVGVGLPHRRSKPKPRGRRPGTVLASPDPFASAKFSLPLLPLPPSGLPGGRCPVPLNLPAPSSLPLLRANQQRPVSLCPAPPPGVGTPGDLAPASRAPVASHGRGRGAEGSRAGDGGFLNEVSPHA